MNQLSLQALRSFSGVGSIDLHAPSTALLVVDVQSGYVLRDGFTIRRLLDRGLDDAAAQYERQLQVAVPNMRRLLDQARARGQFVIFVNSVNYPGQRGPGGQTINQWIPPNSAEADIVEALDRRPEELLLSKTCSGTFAGTNADLHLRRYGVTSLIVCGVVTDGCVEQAMPVCLSAMLAPH
jgi:nicotinamidase-related amidase